MNNKIYNRKIEVEEYIKGVQEYYHNLDDLEKKFSEVEPVKTKTGLERFMDKWKDWRGLER